MKIHKKPAPRQLLPAIAFVLIFLGLTIFLFTYRRDDHLFQNTVTQLFRDEMSANTLNMHYTLASPAKFGIYDYDVILPCYSPDSRLEGQSATENLISLLASINSSKLSDSDKYTKNLLMNYLTNSLSMSEYSYYEEPLSPSSGMQSQLPILLAEYTFRSRRDVEDYLKLLDQTDEYFASLLLFEQEKAEAGLFMSSPSLQKVLEQCSTVLTKDALSGGSHFLQTTFVERLNSLYAAGEITSEDAKYYIAQNNRLLSTVLLPAYEALYDGLFVLEDEALPLEGLAAKPEGTSYYELLLISETGSYRPVSEIKQLLLDTFEEESLVVQELVLSAPKLAAYSYSEALDAAFPYEDAERMLADLRFRMQDDFPALPLQQGAPEVTVKTVSESLQDYCAPAFYLTAPLDDTTSNVIYINEKQPTAGLDLYTTLAHEGYPGHLYQNVYHNRLALSSENNYVREILWYSGYMEGWALYVEFLSYDYASDLMTELKEDDLALLIQLEKHNRSLQLCLYSMLDIMIHYENASREQIGEILASVGITEAASQNAIYAYLVEEPANYLKYYLSYLEITALKDTARTQWDSNYSDYAFHTFFLDCGPSDFSSLGKRLSDTGTGENPDTGREPLESITALAPVWLYYGKNHSDYAMLSPK